MLIFKKERMKSRIEKAGLLSQWTEDVEEIATDLDGQPAYPNCWKNVVNDEPLAWVVGRSGKGQYVNIEDCV